ncbi:hypothetical protein QR680_002701 [Steinernema hermaphroditum]|uniref:Uncharacterized protein n=1 Tax=Steinernema hermaphroditum TaxID=289476 RepID=A0AA39H3P8_9BILA|nr:hypothetical protein QR680_002701 [Steinernema hermaphroditum]
MLNVSTLKETNKHVTNLPPLSRIEQAALSRYHRGAHRVWSDKLARHMESSPEANSPAMPVVNAPSRRSPACSLRGRAELEHTYTASESRNVNLPATSFSPAFVDH